MIPVTDLRSGQAFLSGDEPYQVLEYKHTQLARGTANIRVKVRHLETGNVVVKTFISGARVEPIDLQSRSLQYLYQDGESFYFMDDRTFEQFSLPVSLLEGKEKFLQEGSLVKVVFWEEKPLMVELPVSLTFEVKQTAPGVKGNTVSASFKPATLVNGLKVKVPLFIKAGDKIKVDTRSGEYLKKE